MLVGQGQFVVKWRHNADTEDYINVWGYAADDWDQDVSVDTAHAAYDQFAGFLSFMSDEAHLVGVEQELAVVGGVQVAVWDEVQDGANDFAASPGNVCYLLHKFTNGFGTGRSGRSYVPGVLETKVNPAGVLDGAWQDSISDTGAALVDAFNGSDLPFLVVNRGLRVDPTDPPPRVPTIEPSPPYWEIQSVQCDPTIGTQRRRIRR